MPTTAPTRAAIYVKEAAGYPKARTPRNSRPKNVKSSASSRGSRSAPATATRPEAGTSLTG